MLGISFDTPADNKAFWEKNDFPFPLLCDTDKSVSILYGAADSSSSNPSRISYLIDAQGKIQKAYGSVTPSEHAEEDVHDLG